MSAIGSKVSIKETFMMVMTAKFKFKQLEGFETKE